MFPGNPQPIEEHTTRYTTVVNIASLCNSTYWSEPSHPCHPFPTTLYNTAPPRNRNQKTVGEKDKHGVGIAEMQRIKKIPKFLRLSTMYGI